MDFIQGGDFSLHVTFANPDGSPVDITTGTGSAMIKALVHDTNAAALVTIDSTADAALFDFTGGASGLLVVTFAGTLTAGLVITTKLAVYAQAEVAVGTHRYRSDNLTLTLGESVIKI